MVHKLFLSNPYLRFSCAADNFCKRLVFFSLSCIFFVLHNLKDHIRIGGLQAEIGLNIYLVVFGSFRAKCATP